MARDRINTVDDDGDWTEARFGPFSIVSRLKQWPVKDLVALTLSVVAAGAIAINALFMQTGPHPAPIFALAPPEPAAVATPVAAPVAEPARPVRTTASGDPRGSVTDATGAVHLPRPRPPEISAVKTVAPARTEAQGQRTRGELIADIQRELSRRGFYDGAPDGFYGPKTDAAIRDFEQSARLKASSEPNEALLAAIVRSNVSTSRPTPPAPIPVAARPDPLAELISPPPRRLIAVQRVLSEWGYGQLRPTGVLDRETEAAIEKFERDRNLPVSGRASERVLRELATVTGRPID